MDRDILRTDPSEPGAVCASPIEDDGAGIRSRRASCGVVTVWSETADTDAFCEALARHAERDDFALALVWFSPTRHDGRTLAATLAREAPDLRHAGCSTSGEVTPDGLQAHGVLALLLPSAYFRVSVTVLENVHELGMETIARRALGARTRFFAADPTTPAEDVFAMCLIDSLVHAEEAVTTALDRGLDGVPLVGGSAGDDLEFHRTEQIADGCAHTHGALLVLIACRLPFRLFTDHNFVPTEQRLVVTRSDPDRRVVHEFDAEPAAEAYARAIGVDASALDARSFASRALVVRIGGEYYCRSIRQLNDDGSLTFFCAIDDGLVLTVARSEGMVAASRAAIERVESEIGPLTALFGFDCVCRRIDARHRNTIERIQTLYREKGFVGFNTYGEQYRSMHANQTLIGIAIGHPRAGGTASRDDATSADALEEDTVAGEAWVP